MDYYSLSSFSFLACLCNLFVSKFLQSISMTFIMGRTSNECYENLHKDECAIARTCQQ